MKLIDAELLEKIKKIRRELDRIWIWYIKQDTYDEDNEFEIMEILNILDNLEEKLDNKKDDDE